eukprot:15452810-Alexandrium_andersonii.AAC.1
MGTTSEAQRDGRAQAPLQVEHESLRAAFKQFIPVPLEMVSSSAKPADDPFNVVCSKLCSIKVWGNMSWYCNVSADRWFSGSLRLTTSTGVRTVIILPLMDVLSKMKEPGATLKSVTDSLEAMRGDDLKDLLGSASSAWYAEVGHGSLLYTPMGCITLEVGNGRDNTSGLKYNFVNACSKRLPQVEAIAAKFYGADGAKRSQYAAISSACKSAMAKRP